MAMEELFAGESKNIELINRKYQVTVPNT